MASESLTTPPGRSRILILHTHPVQYLAPLFRRYAARPELDLVVAYRVTDPGTDPGFGQKVDWGLSLTGGYTHVDLGVGAGRNSLRAHLRLARLIWRGRFDLVIAYGYSFPASWTSLLVSRLAGVPWAFLSDSHQMGGGRLGRHLKGLALRFLLSQSAGVLAASNRSVELYRPFLGHRARLVPHAVDDALFAAQRDPRSADGPTVFLFVGKLDRNKRVIDVIQALSGVENAHLWIVGTGPEEEALKQAAKGLDGRVSFFGFVDQLRLAEIFAKADVVVLPSERETFGLVVSEGAAAGCTAIVSSACGVVDSLVLHNETGLVYETGDVEELANALRAMTNPATRERLAREMQAKQLEWSAGANEQAFVDAALALGRRRS